MFDTETKHRILSEETARFIDGSFGQLDLSGILDLTHPVTEMFELQDRHGFNRIDESGLAGINQLKQLIANPPSEVVEELVRETHNPDLAEQLADDRQGALKYPANQPRPLKASQRLRAEQLAANGDVLGGIVEYIKGRISEQAGYEVVAFTLADPLAFTTDPAMRPIPRRSVLLLLGGLQKGLFTVPRAAAIHP